MYFYVCSLYQCVLFFVVLCLGCKVCLLIITGMRTIILSTENNKKKTHSQRKCIWLCFDGANIFNFFYIRSRFSGFLCPRWDVCICCCCCCWDRKRCKKWQKQMLQKRKKAIFEKNQYKSKSMLLSTSFLTFASLLHFPRGVFFKKSMECALNAFGV